MKIPYTSINFIFKLITLTIVSIIISSSLCASELNKDTQQNVDQNKHLSNILKQISTDLNSQTPLQMDEHTQLMNTVVIDKTIVFTMILPNIMYSDIDSEQFTKEIKSNLNHVACQDEMTRTLIDHGVQYTYIYHSADRKQISLIVINNYDCK